MIFNISKKELKKIVRSIVDSNVRFYRHYDKPTISSSTMELIIQFVTVLLSKFRERDFTPYLSYYQTLVKAGIINTQDWILYCELIKGIFKRSCSYADVSEIIFTEIMTHVIVQDINNDTIRVLDMYMPNDLSSLVGEYLFSQI